MKTKVYIAGPMSGLPEFNRPAFHLADVLLTKSGKVVLNPATLPDGLSQPEYMDICCAMVRCADALFMLNGWERSNGAVAEYHLAKKLGKDILFQSENSLQALSAKAYERESTSQSNEYAVKLTFEELKEIEITDLMDSFNNAIVTGYIDNRLEMIINLGKFLESHRPENNGVAA